MAYADIVCLQPLSVTYIREKSDEEETPASPQTPSHPRSDFRPPISPLPYGAVRPVNSGLGYYPSRVGGIVTIHPPQSIVRSPPSISTVRLSPAAVPPNPLTRPPPPRPPRAARPPQPPAARVMDSLRRTYQEFRQSVYVVALLNDLGIGRQRRPRNADKPAPPKPIEGMQVNVLVAMPSQERKLREKLRRESHTGASFERRHSDPAKGKEVLPAVDVYPPEISAEFGELVIGTTKIPWKEAVHGDGD